MRYLVIVALTLALTGCGASHLVRTLSREGYDKIEVSKGHGTTTVRGKRETPAREPFWGQE